MCWCWPFADAWLEDPPSRTPTPQPQSEKVEYEYVSVPCPCGCKPPTVVQTTSSPPAAMAAEDEEYEHWPDNGRLQAVPAAPAPRYDHHNGLYEHTYRPTGQVKDAAPAPEAPKQDAPPPPPQQYVQYVPYLQMGYDQMPYMPYSAPAYFGYGGTPLYPPAYTTAPAEATKAEGKPKAKPKDKPKAPSPRKWQGRTKAEVEEDDMKIAAKEGAYAERKVQPLGLADDQVVWVVEGEGNVLRTFAEVKEAKGEWNADPRFKDSWYFVRAAEEKK